MSLADLLLRKLPDYHFPDRYIHFRAGQSPLSTWPSAGMAIAVYLALIFGIEKVMLQRKPLKLNAIFQIHNLFLSVVSFVLLVLIVEAIAPVLLERGFFYGMCARESLTLRLEFYYMISYYMKYIELLDTVFMALKKKPLTFLHVFHHSATAILIYSTMIGRPSLSWFPVGLNLSVHVLMYYYYYATACGRKIWWKKYVTKIQIIQFILDLTFIFLSLGYIPFAKSYARFLPQTVSCAGAETTAWFGCIIAIIYLSLFVSFYKKTYTPKQKLSKENAGISPNEQAKPTKGS
ncbi:hypothetical protein M422DRAFT_189826 [Sphaerobolus stellatus SS14]|uniref:Elongation of fatty acids protein n=1 Tax=Sphaerobolus stellatus (strain SS14) TaxID=990650 RepID=A0A0C9U2I6_SPHS4|nr:hypothetical protein M422DRAFT_189826 [Sphaerobolus stellatus SS14]